jgi:hypothetical protein
MPRFRRRETLAEKLAREGGLDAGSLPFVRPEPLDPLPFSPSLPGAPLFSFLHPERPRRWDAVVAAEAPEVRGDHVEFVALPDGTVLVEDERGDAELAPLADAVEADLAPPYRAEGVRRSETLWAVSAVAIRVVELEAPGESITLSVHGGERELVVDGRRSHERIPDLEALGEGEAFAVSAERLDGNLWEVRVSAL